MKIALIMPVADIIKPTERLIPPVIRTNSMPMLQMVTTDACLAIVRKLDTVANFALIRQKKMMVRIRARTMPYSFSSFPILFSFFMIYLLGL